MQKKEALAMEGSLTDNASICNKLGLLARYHTSEPLDFFHQMHATLGGFWPAARMQRHFVRGSNS